MTTHVYTLRTLTRVPDEAVPAGTYIVNTRREHGALAALEVLRAYIGALGSANDDRLADAFHGAEPLVLPQGDGIAVLLPVKGGPTYFVCESLTGVFERWGELFADVAGYRVVERQPLPSRALPTQVQDGTRSIHVYRTAKGATLPDGGMHIDEYLTRAWKPAEVETFVLALCHYARATLAAQTDPCWDASRVGEETVAPNKHGSGLIFRFALQDGRTVAVAEAPIVPLHQQPAQVSVQAYQEIAL